MSGRRAVDNKVKEIVPELRDGLPLDDNAVGLCIDKGEDRRWRQGHVRGTVDISHAGSEENDLTVGRGVERQQGIKGACSCRHLLVQHVA